MKNKKTKLGKSYELTDKNIDKLSGKIGVYIFGTMEKSKKQKMSQFDADYVGRSYTDLKVELKQQLRNHIDEGFTHFKFIEDEDPYFLECQLVCELGKDKELLNKIHPARPSEEDYPKCSCDIDD